MNYPFKFIMSVCLLCTGELQNNIIKYDISYNAAYCAMLAYDFLRIITDASDVILKEAAKAGIVHTMLKMLNVLKSDLGRLKVATYMVLYSAFMIFVYRFQTSNSLQLLYLDSYRILLNRNFSCISNLLNLLKSFLHTSVLMIKRCTLCV